jgi:hypothetical protein
MPVAAAPVGAASEGEEGGESGVARVEAAPPPAKLTRYEAMWTDCDPALWEYVVV